jgi:hypothetical protein
LKPLIAKLVNNGLITERHHGQMFVIEPGPSYGDARARFKPDLVAWREAIERTADLFLRFPRTIDAEIAATVHFAARELAGGGTKPSEGDVLAAVQRWKLKRRPPLAEEEVASAIRHLNMLGWVDLEASPEIRLPEHERALA